ncbi:hypothetical protein L6452_35225 [Arctium lappa]|uniref:Uncharacterized protein n=1 Tax=Arctium lappa TaxID=4217 RepID=A0ACB8Y6Y6_ARCLA|nr:hypothetical protein L6452_35225 [Arctium lappa]
MYLKVKLNWNVVIPAENIDLNGLMLQKEIMVLLLDDFATKKATKDLGYLVAVTTLDKIGEGKVREHSGDVLFPVEFTCLSLKVFRGECIMIGVKYMEAQKEFQVVVGLEGDYLNLSS